MIKFGTGGWRAVIADGFTKANLRLLAAGLCRQMDREGHAGAQIVVGYDRRFLAKESAHWLAEVLAGSGYRVLMPKRDAAGRFFTEEETLSDKENWSDGFLPWSREALLQMVWEGRANSGYGYSDEYEGDRSVDTTVDQNRAALEALGIEGPFILVPHSAGGIEAIWWAEHYPDEVEGIIGLDSSIPAQYTAYRVPQDPAAWEAQDMDEAVAAMAVYDFFMYDAGLIRLLMNPDKLLPALSSDVLTEAEKEQYRAIAYDMYCRGSGAAFQRETIMTARQLADLQEYCSSPVPDVPTLFFVSDGRVMEQVMEPSDWIRIHTEYVSGLSNGTVIYLDCGHYVHAERPAEVAAGILSFMESLDLQGG